MGAALADQTKWTAAVDTDAALLGLGLLYRPSLCSDYCSGLLLLLVCMYSNCIILAPEHVMHINGQSVFLADAPIRKVFL